jgi:outer membrane protein OmpA-like peptidoglycan-associated protein
MSVLLRLQIFILLGTRYIIITFLLLVSGNSASGQNLVINGNFEDVNLCVEMKVPCSPSAWFYINRTPLGFHKRKETAGHYNYVLGLGQFGDSVYQYWQTMLSDKLAIDNEYILTCDVKGDPASFEGYGFLFTAGFIYAACDTQLSAKNYIPIDGSHIEKRFRADGYNQHMIVGRFREVNRASKGFVLDNVQIIPASKYKVTNSSIKDSLYQITRRHDHLPNCNDHSNSAKLVISTQKTMEVDSFTLENLEFDVDKYTTLNPELLEKYKSKLDAATIQQILISGYADSTGAIYHNLELSQARANAIKQLLVDRYGIPADLISAKGNGVSNRYRESSRNRRVEIVIYRVREG